MPDTDPTKLRRQQIVPRLLALLLLAFLAYPIDGLTGEHPVLFLALAGFAGGYVWVVWRNTPHLHTNQTPIALFATIGCGALLVPTLGAEWFAGLSFFASVMLLINFPQRLWHIVLPALLVTSVAVALFFLNEPPGAVVFLLLQVLIGSGLQVALYRQLKLSNELRQARIELTQLAVTQERLRIARDLHDILGQHLSAISLKGSSRGPHRRLRPPAGSSRNDRGGRIGTRWSRRRQSSRVWVPPSVAHRRSRIGGSVTEDRRAADHRAASSRWASESDRRVCRVGSP